MDGQTDRQTDRFAISVSRVSMLTRDKNRYRKLNTFIPRMAGNDAQEFYDGKVKVR